MSKRFPLRAKTCPGYAVRLYDSHLAHPELVRLATWARLERTPTGDLFHFMPGHDTVKLESIADAQAKGIVDSSIPPAEVLSIVTAMSMAWSPSSAIYTASIDEPEAEHGRRREALARAVQGAFSP